MGIHKIQRPLPVAPRSDATLGPEQQAKLRHASQLYEKQFLQEMVKAMRQTVSHGAMTAPSMAENIYSQQLDEQYVEAWGDRGGVGLADLIFNQLKERFENHGRGGVERPQGPIPVGPQDTPKPLPVPEAVESLRIGTGEGGETSFFIRPRAEAFGGKVAVVSPWAGTVTRVVENEDGLKAVWIDHEGQGLRSTLTFRGRLERQVDGNAGPTGRVDELVSPTARTVGEAVAAGERLGELLAGATEVAWRVTNAGSSEA